MKLFTKWMEAKAQLGNNEDHDLWGQPAPMAIPLNKNPSGNPYIDPRTGEDFSGNNPHYDNNTGAILDDKKAREWEIKKRQVKQLNADMSSNQQGRKSIVEKAEKEAHSLLDSAVDGFIANKIANPFQHPGFNKKFWEIMNKHGVTQDEVKEIYLNLKSKLNYISSTIANPERHQSHMVNSKKQLEKNRGVRPMNV